MTHTAKWAPHHAMKSIHISRSRFHDPVMMMRAVPAPIHVQTSVLTVIGTTVGALIQMPLSKQKRDRKNRRPIR